MLTRNTYLTTFLLSVWLSFFLLRFFNSTCQSAPVTSARKWPEIYSPTTNIENTAILRCRHSRENHPSVFSNELLWFHMLIRIWNHYKRTFGFTGTSGCYQIMSPVHLKWRTRKSVWTTEKTNFLFAHRFNGLRLNELVPSENKSINNTDSVWSQRRQMCFWNVRFRIT